MTQDQTEALTIGDRIAVHKDGELQQVGTPRELYGAPKNVLVGGFIGSPAMNPLPVTSAGESVSFGGRQFALVGEAAAMAPNAGAITFGERLN